MDKYEALFNKFEIKSAVTFKSILLFTIVTLIGMIKNNKSIDDFRRFINGTSYLANSLVLAFKGLAGKDFNVNDKLDVMYDIQSGKRPDLEQEINATTFNAQFPPIMTEIANVSQTDVNQSRILLVKSADYINTHLTFVYTSWKILSGMIATNRTFSPIEKFIMRFILPTNPLMITQPLIFDTFNETTGEWVNGENTRLQARDYFLLANARQFVSLDDNHAPPGEMTPGRITPNALDEYRGIVDMIPYELYVLSRFNPMWRYDDESPTTPPVLSHHLFDRYMHFRKNRNYHSSFMKTGIMSFLFSKVCLLTHQNMADAGLPPMSSCFICVQPKITFYTVSAYWLQSKKGIIFFRAPDLGEDKGFDVTHKKYVFNYTAWMGAVIPDPNDAIVIPHVLGA